jgi:hypothetical protein
LNTNLQRLQLIEPEFKIKCELLNVSLSKYNDLAKQKCQQDNQIVLLNSKTDYVRFTNFKIILNINYHDINLL